MATNSGRVYRAVSALRGAFAAAFLRCRAYAAAWAILFSRDTPAHLKQGEQRGSCGFCWASPRLLPLPSSNHLAHWLVQTPAYFHHSALSSAGTRCHHTPPTPYYHPPPLPHTTHHLPAHTTYTRPAPHTHTHHLTHCTCTFLWAWDRHEGGGRHPSAFHSASLPWEVSGPLAWDRWD